MWTVRAWKITIPVTHFTAFRTSCSVFMCCYLWAVEAADYKKGGESKCGCCAVTVSLKPPLPSAWLRAVSSSRLLTGQGQT